MTRLSNSGAEFIFDAIGSDHGQHCSFVVLRILNSSLGMATSYCCSSLIQVGMTSAVISEAWSDYVFSNFGRLSLSLLLNRKDRFCTYCQFHIATVFRNSLICSKRFAWGNHRHFRNCLPCRTFASGSPLHVNQCSIPQFGTACRFPTLHLCRFPERGCLLLPQVKKLLCVYLLL